MLFLKLIRRPKLFKIGLRCLNCGHTFTQRVERVYCDLGTVERKQRGENVPFSEFFVPAHVVCPYCQSADRYDLSPWQYIKTSLRLLLMRFERDNPNRWLQVLYLGTLEGRIMHPFEMRAWYAKQVAQHPQKADLHLRYANTLRSLGLANEAEEEYRATLGLVPKQPEALINLAASLGQRGEEEEALTLLRQLARIKPRNEQQRGYVAIAQEVLDGKLSPGALQVGNPLISIQKRSKRK